ncbi:hypothetical protein CRE_04233 [Caenorhabditis remanei]|uniref:Uncharacterized protein n=1 Tax=Caenorhabditis remanei TaxID=31234 RepID=E3MYV8_CAERE|nr:hypothetical protein CRE_04233 [Caenorhabditis remanei]
MAYLYEMRVYNRPPGETPTPVESPSISIESLESVHALEAAQARAPSPIPPAASNFGTRCVNFWIGFAILVFFLALLALVLVCKFAPHWLPGRVMVIYTGAKFAPKKKLIMPPSPPEDNDIPWLVKILIGFLIIAAVLNFWNVTQHFVELNSSCETLAAQCNWTEVMLRECVRRNRWPVYLI